jgi:hypothetical protein
MNNWNMTPIFVFIFVVIGITGFIIFRLGSNASLKRRLFPIFFIVAGIFFVGFSYVTTSNPKNLFFVIPATIFVIIINIYRVRFCDACGKINYSTNSLKRPNYCIECGEKLV